MRILLTGATGYIGGRFAARCAELGDETHALVRVSSATQHVGRILGSDHVHYSDGSVGSLVKAIGEARPEVVVHLASKFLVQHEPTQIDELLTSNVIFGCALLEGMIANSVDRLINVGTTWQHFNLEEYNPVNLYAATKKAFEDVLRYYVEATALRALTLELPDTYGPEDPRQKIVNILIKSARDQIPIDLTAGEQLLDLVHVDDVVEALREALQTVRRQQAKYLVFSVSSGRPVRLKDLVAFATKLSGNQSVFRVGARGYRAREMMTPWTRGMPLPGWSPAKNLEAFLSECIGTKKS